MRWPNIQFTGTPVDPRLVAAFRKQTAMFDQAMALSKKSVTPIRIPFENGTLPAYFIPAVDYPDSVRPLLILTSGYDGTITDMYFASAVAATNRGVIQRGFWVHSTKDLRSYLAQRNCTPGTNGREN